MASTSSSKSSFAVDSYIGSFISLISKYEIRYEGVLYHINIQDATIGLKNVRSYGTEGRKKDGPQIPPGEKVYEFILFRGSDVKDLQVKSSPPVQTEEQIHNDPAIIQSHYAGIPISSPKSVLVGKISTESAQVQSTHALMNRAYTTVLPSYQSANHVDSPAGATQFADASFCTPMCCQGYDGTSIASSCASQNSIPFQPSSMLPVQNHMQIPGPRDSAIMGITNALESINPVPSIASSTVYPRTSPSPTPLQHSVYCDLPSSIKTSLPSQAAYIASDKPTKFLISSGQDARSTEAQSVGQAITNPMTIHPFQSSNPVSSFVGSTSIPLQIPPPSLLSSDHLAHSGLRLLSPTQKVNLDQDIGALTPSSTSSPLISTSVSQAPLLPLPISANQHRYSTTQFTEEFDFQAMNEKFKKDEVWGYLGRAKQRDKIEGTEENAVDQNMANKGVLVQQPNFDPKLAYKKDDFFDTISCNSLTHRKNGHNHFSERMKLDNETFGRFHQRPNLVYGPGRGNSYHGPPNWGRGYGYGGRGDRNMPF